MALNRMKRVVTSALFVVALWAPVYAENCNPNWKAPDGIAIRVQPTELGGLHLFGSLDGKYADVFYSPSAGSNLMVWTNADGAIEIRPHNTRRIMLASYGAYKSGGGEWGVLSDERLKTNIRNFTVGLAEIERLRPRSFKYAGHTEMTPADGRDYIGLIAQEARQVMPFLVKEDSNELLDGKPLLKLDPSALTYALINAVKEEAQISDDVEAKLDSLYASLCRDQRNARACKK